MSNYSKIRLKNFGAALSKRQEQEILQALNSKKYTPRQTANSQVMEDLPEIAREELEQLTVKWNLLTLEERKGIAAPQQERLYIDNCHTLTRIANEQYNWEVVYGYAFKKNNTDPTLVLRHHSISKNQAGNLFELTCIFGTQYCEFVEHTSGANFIDLEAY